MKCPSCGAEASGKFCSSCGSPLAHIQCGSCGSPVMAGAKFCTECGTAVTPLGGRGGGAGGGGGGSRLGSGSGGRGAAPLPAAGVPRGGGSNLAWWVAGAMMVVVLVVLGYPAIRGSVGSGGTGQTGVSPAGAGGGGASAIDLSTMSLEEQGTLLFNRVMTSNSAGDTADVAFFLPKALFVYEELSPTDPDGLYHYALLFLVGGDYGSALAKVEEGLAEVPDYLLLLAAGAEASLGLGDQEGAREYYSHFVRVYDTEMQLMRPGYEHHERILPSYLEDARAFLAPG